jgi:hypothetical protein
LLGRIENTKKSFLKGLTLRRYFQFGWLVEKLRNIGAHFWGDGTNLKIPFEIKLPFKNITMKI